MAAPTTAASVKILLANPEPSTHGPTLTNGHVRFPAPVDGTADVRQGSTAFPFAQE
jgi:hypothetical protein